MRRITIGDLQACGAVLGAVPNGLWPRACDAILARADLADRYRKRFGRRHAFGDGTLAAALDDSWPRALAPVGAVSVAIFAARARRRQSITRSRS